MFHGRNVLSDHPVVMPFAAAQLIARSKSLFPVMSLNVAAAAEGLPAYLHRNVTIEARLQVFHGRKVLSDQPFVIFCSTAQEIAFRKSLFPGVSAGISRKVAICAGAGHPASLHKNVTTEARLQVFHGRNVPSAQPVVMFFAAAQ